MENQVVEPEVNQEELRSDIIKEVKGDKGSGKAPWEVRMEQDHPELPKTKREPEPEENVEEEPKEKPDSEEQPAEPEAAPAEKQPDEEAQPVDAKKDTAAKEYAYIAEYATKNNLKLEDAKAEVESLRAISKKYGDDPVKIAKAYQSVQSAYDKQKVTATSTLNPAVAAIAANPRSYVVGEVKKNADKLIQEYRDQNPARSRDMDDEQVTEEIVDRATYAISNQIKGYEIQLKKDAASKREEFLSSTSEADRRYLPDIKPVLEQLPDHQIVSNTFNYKDLIRWAKGSPEAIQRLVKETEDRIHQQYASKDRKIVGEISRPAQSTKLKQSPEQSKSTGMSKWQKDQALQMFASTGMTDDEKYEAYLDVTKKKK